MKSNLNFKINILLASQILWQIKMTLCSSIASIQKFERLTHWHSRRYDLNNIARSRWNFVSSKNINDVTLAKNTERMIIEYRAYLRIIIKDWLVSFSQIY